MSSTPKYRKKTLGSYPYFTVVFGITISLYVIGLFYLLLSNAHKLSQLVKENYTIHVYLQKDISPESKDSLQTVLSAKNYILHKNGVAQITFISKENAAKKFIEETGEDFFELLGENPLRDAFEVRIAEGFAEKKQLGQIKAQLQAIPSIFEIDFKQSMIEDINKNIQLIFVVLISFTVVLVFSVILLINNTIKLAMFSQRFLIRSMQLVGATAMFIQKPFIGRSVVHGLLGGVVASVLLAITLQYAHSYLPELVLLYDPANTFALFGILLVCGAVICMLSTIFAIRKYLRMQLEDLY